MKLSNYLRYLRVVLPRYERRGVRKVGIGLTDRDCKHSTTILVMTTLWRNNNLEQCMKVTCPLEQ